MSNNIIELRKNRKENLQKNTNFLEKFNAIVNEDICMATSSLQNDSPPRFR